MDLKTCFLVLFCFSSIKTLSCYMTFTSCSQKVKRVNESWCSGALTWQCTREVENTLVELTDGVPLVQEHLDNLAAAHRLRQRVLVGQVHVSRGG